MYELINKNNVVGYRGKGYGADNINKLPKSLLIRLESTGIVRRIEKSDNVKNSKTEKTEKNDTE